MGSYENDFKTIAKSFANDEPLVFFRNFCKAIERGVALARWVKTLNKKDRTTDNYIVAIAVLSYLCCMVPIPNFYLKKIDLRGGLKQGESSRYFKYFGIDLSKREEEDIRRYARNAFKLKQAKEKNNIKT